MADIPALSNRGRFSGGQRPRSSNVYRDFGLDLRVVSQELSERVILSILYLLIFISYAGLGRDVFYNQLNSGTAQNDPIGAVLPFLRIIVCVAIFLTVVSSAGLTWAISKIPLMFVPFWLMAAASSLWAVEQKDTLRNALMLIPLCVAMPIAIHQLGVLRSVRLALHLIAAVCVLSALLAVLVPSIGRHTGLEIAGVSHAGRWRGIFLHKNGLGPWAAYGAIFSLTHARIAGGPRIYWWLVRTSAWACLLFSESVTALMLAGFLLMASFFFFLLKRYSLPIVIGLGIVAPTVALMLGLPAIDYFLGLLARDATLTGRTEIWELAPIWFWESPWIGHGYMSLGGPEFLKSVAVRVGQAIPGPESGYWTLLLDLGIFGALAFAVPYYAAMRNGFTWLQFVSYDDRCALEFFIITLASTLILAITESNSLIVTGFDGIIPFAAFFALQTAPKSPSGIRRGEFKLAKYW